MIHKVVNKNENASRNMWFIIKRGRYVECPVSAVTSRDLSG